MTIDSSLHFLVSIFLFLIFIVFSAGISLCILFVFVCVMQDCEGCEFMHYLINICSDDLTQFETCL